MGPAGPLANTSIAKKTGGGKLTSARQVYETRYLYPKGYQFLLKANHTDIDNPRATTRKIVNL